jgi:NAD(P)-dependent dehydrogenase (short-subunit alcohol dehydrogenase family)
MDERVAAVTGGEGAIGSAIARSLESHGMTVVSVDSAASLPCDLADEAQTRRAARALLERHGHCDVLVHAAAALDRAAWRRG